MEALFVAAGIGGVIAERAFLAGAAGGCQAEIGSASAMAAGGVVHLSGGSAKEIANAAALALKICWDLPVIRLPVWWRCRV